MERRSTAAEAAADYKPVVAPTSADASPEKLETWEPGRTDDVGADGDGDDGLGGAEGGGVRLQRAGGGPAAAAGVAEIQVLHRRPLHRHDATGADLSDSDLAAHAPDERQSEHRSVVGWICWGKEDERRDTAVM